MNFSVNELRHCVALQERIYFKDQRGGFYEEWKTCAHLWAKLTPIVATQRGNPMQNRGKRLEGTEENSRLYKVTTRNRPVIKKGMRLHHKKSCFFIVEKPFEQDGHQFFTVSEILQSDGGA